MDTSLALFLNGKSFKDRELRVTKYLKSAEAIEKQKQKDMAKNGRMKLRHPNKGKKVSAKKVTEKKVTEKKTEKKEVEKKTGKKERQPKKEKKEKKEKMDLSFMGKKATLSSNAVNAKRRLLKKQKK